MKALVFHGPGQRGWDTVRLVELGGGPVITRRLICEYCDDVIGTYESAVIVVDGGARETSRAAEPSIVAEPAELYHRPCYLERFGPLVD